MIGAILKSHWRLIAGGVGLLVLIGTVIALVVAVRGLIGDARESGLRQGRAEVEAKWKAETAGRAAARAELSDALAKAFNGLDGSLQQTIERISSSGRTIRVEVDKEMAGDPRYTSADCALGDGVRARIDAARGLSRPATAAPVHSGGVPASGAAVRLEFGEPGPGRR